METVNFIISRNSSRLEKRKEKKYNNKIKLKKIKKSPIYFRRSRPRRIVEYISPRYRDLRRAASSNSPSLKASALAREAKDASRNYYVDSRDVNNCAKNRLYTTTLI
ncbi:hypothetical protein PUN28_005331 [Cardiocondyla obscurior]|uniref:Uncharacterized protein n=1 Tax=Cardiocondyla obscurior TaxID=286306 RepID=A0AAW2GH93_9HYME